MLSFGWMALVRLFVYGTLRHGQPNHGELGDSRRVGSAVTVPRFEVREAAGYPVLLPGERAVEGELYEVDEALLPRLDAFEGGGYVRGQVTLADGSLALAYLAASGTR